MDVHVPRAITAGLRIRGVDVLTAQDDGRAEAPDPDLLDRARDLGRVLVTEDDDLLRDSARRQRTGEAFAGVVYGRQRDLLVGPWIDDLELLAMINEPEDFANRVEYLPVK